MTKAPFLGFDSLILRIYPESASLRAFSKRAVLVLKHDLEQEVN
jgi:xanthine/CO dehydrogenase XdhC/CoxF family maturation factor